MDRKSRDQLALVTLVSAKIFGIAGLVLGATNYRLVGGVLLGFDGVLLLAAVVLAIHNFRDNVVEEKAQKQLLKQMVEEGTLNQYLADLRSAARDAAGSEPRLI